MSASILQILLQLSLVSSAAVLVVAVLRKPLRYAAGTRAAYWLWILVPANVLAVLLPVPTHEMELLTSTLRSAPAEGMSAVLATVSDPAASSNYAGIVLTLWTMGACLMAAWLVARQRAFVRSLGPLVAGPEGTFRSERITAPMLVGAWRARVIIPMDFETRYREEHRRLMLAHERAHQQRGDALVNSLGALWLCVSWFNPLVYWALGRIRFDQELACDALVVARSDLGRRRYADALLSAQLTSESAWRVPAGCHWQSNHPLKERIAMLKLSSPALSRRLLGTVSTVALAVCGMYVVSASHAQAPASQAAESTDKKFSIDARDTDTREVLQMIARKGGRNVLVGDQVSGKITVQLKDVTWREALNVVTQSQGLVTRDSGNITIVDVPQK